MFDPNVYLSPLSPSLSPFSPLSTPSRCVVCLPVQSIPAVESMSSSIRPATAARPALSARQDMSRI